MSRNQWTNIKQLSQNSNNFIKAKAQMYPNQIYPDELNNFQQKQSNSSPMFGSKNADTPQILLQLRQKNAQLKRKSYQLKNSNISLKNEVDKKSQNLKNILNTIEIQERKSKSLNLLVNDLQRQIDDNHLMNNSEQDLSKVDSQNRILRQILVKLAQKIGQDQKIVSFLRQTSKSSPKTVQFIKKSNYLQGQTQLLAKFKSQLNNFTNSNLQCSRKWSQLQRQTQRLQKQQGFLRVQNQRLKTQLRDHYEHYLQKLNKNKAITVSFNQTQKQRIVTQYLVQQIAMMQQQRNDIQQQFKNLKYHQQSLLQQNARINMQNRELKSFFIGRGNEQQKLAQKMKARIQQLNDFLLEIQKTQNLPHLPVNDVLEYVRQKHKNLQDTSGFLDKRIKEQQQGKQVMDQKQVIQFFENVLRNKDQTLIILRQKQMGLMSKLRQMKIKRQLLDSQIQNLQSGLDYHDYRGNIYSSNQTKIMKQQIENYDLKNDKKINSYQNTNQFSKINTTTSAFLKY